MRRRTVTLLRSIPLTLALPCGFSASGLPLGFQLSGRAFEETTVFRLGHAYQKATDWHTRRPPV